MAVNQQRRAEKLVKARAKAKERKKQREQSQSQWAPEFGDFQEATDAGYDIRDIDISPDPATRFGLRKTSEVLLELIEPLYSVKTSSDKILAIAKVGMMAWNLALMPESKRKSTFHEAARLMPRELQVILFGLIERKLSLFPDDDRYIVDVVLREEGNGHSTLLAMSLVVPPESRR